MSALGTATTREGSEGSSPDAARRGPRQAHSRGPAPARPPPRRPHTVTRLTRPGLLVDADWLQANLDFPDLIVTRSMRPARRSRPAHPRRALPRLAQRPPGPCHTRSSRRRRVIPSVATHRRHRPVRDRALRRSRQLVCVLRLLAVSSLRPRAAHPAGRQAWLRRVLSLTQDEPPENVDSAPATSPAPSTCLGSGDPARRDVQVPRRAPCELRGARTSIAMRRS